MDNVTHGAGRCRPVSALQPGHRLELAHQAAGSLDPASAGEAVSPIGQIESRSRAAAAFFGDRGPGGTAGAARLAGVEDADAAWRDPLRPELAADLLPRRSLGLGQPRGAARDLERGCDADRTQRRRHPGNDRRRDAAELDEDQTRAAATVDAAY